jgi:hypothetical protein
MGYRCCLGIGDSNTSARLSHTGNLGHSRAAEALRSGGALHNGIPECSLALHKSLGTCGSAVGCSKGGAVCESGTEDTLGDGVGTSLGGAAVTDGGTAGAGAGGAVLGKCAALGVGNGTLPATLGPGISR